MSDPISPASSSRVVRGQHFEGRYAFTDRGPYGGVTFDRCTFIGCDVGSPRDLASRTIIRDVRLINCTVQGGYFGPAIVEDVVVDGLRTNGLFQAWAPALRHVTLRGRIGRVMISNVHSAAASREDVETFKAANRRYYENVDWALDISEAEFGEADLRGVPGDLIRRDPETQVLVRRERILDGRWQRLAALPSLWQISLELLLETGMESKVLVAAKRAKDFPTLVAGLRLLQDEGIAEIP